MTPPDLLTGTEFCAAYQPQDAEDARWFALFAERYGVSPDIRIASDWEKVLGAFYYRQGEQEREHDRIIWIKQQEERRVVRAAQTRARYALYKTPEGKQARDERRALRAHQTARAVALRIAGKMRWEIAEELGISLDSVKRRLRPYECEQRRAARQAAKTG